MDKLWDGRVRSYLGERYDAGRNVSDMDFSLKLKERAALLDFKEYASWRETGEFYHARRLQLNFILLTIILNSELLLLLTTTN